MVSRLGSPAQMKGMKATLQKCMVMSVLGATMSLFPRACEQSSEACARCWQLRECWSRGAHASGRAASMRPMNSCTHLPLAFRSAIVPEMDLAATAVALQATLALRWAGEVRTMLRLAPACARWSCCIMATFLPRKRTELVLRGAKCLLGPPPWDPLHEQVGGRTGGVRKGLEPVH